MKIRPVGVQLLHVDRMTYGRIDRQTDRHDKIVFFHNFAKVPKDIQSKLGTVIVSMFLPPRPHTKKVTR